jgi:pimeloyl-ACP methyl ester carboxylesterase
MKASRCWSVPSSFRRASRRSRDRTNDAAANATTINALRTCHDRWTKKGVDLSQYNFDTAAQDVIDLMSVLHIKQANLVALSEIGGGLRNPAARTDVVRTMTLDNPQPPGETSRVIRSTTLRAPSDVSSRLCRRRELHLGIPISLSSGKLRTRRP